jgi:hypothetical protein
MASGHDLQFWLAKLLFVAAGADVGNKDQLRAIPGS